MTTKDRRRFQRIRPPAPIRGAVGTARVYVLDASLGGVSVLHENVLPTPGDICRVEILSDMGPITLDCEVVRTVQHTTGQNGFSKPLCQSGLRVVAADHQSAQRLRTMFGAAAMKPHSQDN
jgi:hypothetical protein